MHESNENPMEIDPIAIALDRIARTTPIKLDEAARMLLAILPLAPTEQDAIAIVSNLASKGLGIEAVETLIAAGTLSAEEKSASRLVDASGKPFRKPLNPRARVPGSEGAPEGGKPSSGQPGTDKGQVYTDARITFTEAEEPTVHIRRSISRSSSGMFHTMIRKTIKPGHCKSAGCRTLGECLCTCKRCKSERKG